MEYTLTLTLLKSAIAEVFRILPGDILQTRDGVQFFYISDNQIIGCNIISSCNGYEAEFYMPTCKFVSKSAEDAQDTDNKLLLVMYQQPFTAFYRQSTEGPNMGITCGIASEKDVPLALQRAPAVLNAVKHAYEADGTATFETVPFFI